MPQKCLICSYAKNRYPLASLFVFLFTAFLAYLDYRTGPSISLHIFYLLPVFISIWFSTERTTLLLLSAISIFFFFDQFRAAFTNTGDGGRYWNFFIGIVSLFLIAVILRRLKGGYSDEHKRILELKTIVETSLDGFWIIDRQGRILEVNDAYCEMTGYSRDELLRMEVADLEAAENKEEIAQHISKITSSGSDRFETKHRRKDGKIIDVEVSTNCPKECSQMFVFLRDITGYKVTEERLRRMASFPHLNPLPVCELNFQGKFTYINPTAKMMFPDLGTTGLNHPWVGDIEPIFNLFQRGESTSYMREIKVNRGYYQQAVHYLPQSGLIRIYGFDITARYRMEETLRDSARIKSEFTSMVSHELRTPLAAIKEGISLVLDGVTGSLNETQEKTLGIARTNVDRLNRLVNEILDFHKLESGRMEFNFAEQDLNHLVKEAWQSMHAVAEKKGLLLMIQLDSALPRMRFDRDKINQVLTNLLNNALKFTEEGMVILETSKGDNYAEVRVKDSGIGIKSDSLEKIFERFTVLEARDGGAGLGLAISKHIIDRHRGKIWAESELGKGSVFHFRLPF